jgi:hypothetical protein
LTKDTELRILIIVILIIKINEEILDTAMGVTKVREKENSACGHPWIY